MPKRIIDYWNSLNGERLVLGVLSGMFTVGLALFAWMFTTNYDTNGTVKGIDAKLEQVIKTNAEQNDRLAKHDERLFEFGQRIITLEQRAANTDRNTQPR